MPPRPVDQDRRTGRTAEEGDEQSETRPDQAEQPEREIVGEAPPLRRVTLKAGKADTVASIAARYKVRAEQVAQWNKVGSGARFKPGQAIVVYSAAPAVVAKAAPAKRAAPRAKAPTRTAAAKPAARTVVKAGGGKGRAVASAAP